MQDEPKLLQSRGRHLRQGVARGIVALGPVAQQDHAQQPLARLQSQHVVQHGPNGRLLASGFLGQLDLAAGDLRGPGFRIEQIRLQLELLGQLGQGRGRIAERLLQDFVAGLAACGVGHGHAPRLIGQHHERGRLLLCLRVDDRRPEHGQGHQQEHEQPQQAQRQPAPRRGSAPRRPNSQRRQQDRGQDRDQQVTVGNWIEREAEHHASL